MTALLIAARTVRAAFVASCVLVLACGGAVEGRPFNVAGDADARDLASDDDAVDDAADDELAGDGSPASDVDSPGDSGGDPIAEAPQPLRLLLVYSSHGLARADCFSDTGASSFAVGPGLAPLAPFRDRMLVVDGVSGLAEATAAHGWGAPYAFTASVALDDPGFQAGEYRYLATRRSLDQVFDRSQYLASMATSYARLPIGTFQTFSTVSAGDRAPVSVSHDPRELLDRVPVRGPATSAYEAWLGGADLGVPETLAEAHARAIASAFADDITRAAVYQVSHIAEIFAIGGHTLSYNELAHDAGPSDLVAHDRLVAARAIVARRVAILLETLAETTVGTDENLLDNTLVVWVDDTGWGPHATPHLPSAHSYRHLPLLVFTPPRLNIAAPLYLKLGSERPYADFLATIAEAAGISDATVGAPIAGAEVIQEALVDRSGSD